MGESYLVFTVVLAVLIGIGAALRITEHYLTKSNNVGDYIGNFSDFSSEFENVGVGGFYQNNKKETPELLRLRSLMDRRREEVKKDKKVNGRIFN